MPVRATADMARTKWLNNLGSATTRMQQGAEAVTVAPGAKAAAAADKWLARVTQSKDKFARNVGRVSLQSWKDAYVNVGIPRVSQGAQAKQQKYLDAMTAFLPYLKQGVDKIDAMPKVTLADSIARATAMIQHNANYQRPNK